MKFISTVSILILFTTIISGQESINFEKSAEDNLREDIMKLSIDNDQDSYLYFSNSTIDNSFYVPEIEGFTARANTPGLVLRGLADIANDNSGAALLHLTPYIVNGSTNVFPVNRHYLGIQGFDTNLGTKPLLEIDEKGYVGLGTEDPKAKLEVTDGDIYISDIDKGIIMKSPDGNCWRGVLDNSGSLSFSGVVCP